MHLNYVISMTTSSDVLQLFTRTTGMSGTSGNVLYMEMLVLRMVAGAKKEVEVMELD